jgi:hypothetical protein
MASSRKPWVLARDAYGRVLEERAQERFGMSLGDFAGAFKAGQFADDPAAYELAVASGASKR